MILVKEGSSFKWEMFGAIHPKLSMIFFDCAHTLWRHGIKDVVITSGIREKTTDSGVHALGRGLDFSGGGIDQETRLFLMEYINTKYPYDPTRPNFKTIVWHEGTGYAGDRAYHFHLQVS